MPHLHKLTRTVIYTFAILFCLNTSAQSIYDTLSTVDKLYGVSTIWKEVSNNFVYFDKVPTLNWDSTYKATIPRALATKNVYEYYQVISRMMGLLQDGHTQVRITQYFYKDLDSPPFSTITLEERGFITRIDKSLVATIPIGSEILAIDGKTWHDFRQSGATLSGIKRSSLVLRVKTPQDKIIEHTFSRNINADRVELYPIRQMNPDVVFRQLPNNIAYVAINTFGSDSVPIKFRQLLPQLRQAKAIVLDIRQNGGGNSHNAEQIAQYLVDRDYVVGPAWKTRVQNAAYRAFGSVIQFNQRDSLALANQAYYRDTMWQSYPPDTFLISSTVQKLALPTVVLIGKSTFSAAEDFLIMLDGASRITTIGQLTAGSSGQPFMFRLPAGMSGLVCSKRDTYPDGRDYIGIGIRPQLLITRTIDDYRDNKDVELENGIQFLTNKIKHK